MANQIVKQGLNREEASKFLGIAPNTLVKLIKDGRIRCLQVGRRKIFPISALEDFLKGT